MEMGMGWIFLRFESVAQNCFNCFCTTKDKDYTQYVNLKIYTSKSLKFEFSSLCGSRNQLKNKHDIWLRPSAYQMRNEGDMIKMVGTNI